MLDSWRFSQDPPRVIVAGERNFVGLVHGVADQIATNAPQEQ